MTGYRKTRKRFRKPCAKCGKMFLPIGTAEKLCESCWEERRGKNEKRRN